MPLRPEEIRCDHVCGIGPDGHWRGHISVHVDGAALMRLGLHPQQPASVVNGPSPPGWWHAAAERNTH